MRTTRVTSDEFRSAFDHISGQARQEPVIITQEGQDALVVVSIEEWARLSRSDRRVGKTEDLSEAWLEAVLRAEVPAEHAELDAELG